MNATAAVRGVSRIPRAGPWFRGIETGEEAAPQSGWGERVECIRNILSQEGHTITQLSAATRQRYGSRSPYFIPATLFYQLRTGVTPHICQIVALSESTGYRFTDWLRMFGFDLQQIPRLQMGLHPERTVLLTPMEDWLDPFPRRHSLDGEALGRERLARATACTSEAVAPTFFWNSAAPALRERGARDRYLFAKIGSGDAAVCPELLPGTIVRVDRYFAQRIRALPQASMERLLWLVEQPKGLTCCRLQWIDDRQIVLLPSRPPWGRWPLRLPTEARILGFVDSDLRPGQQARLRPRAGPMDLAALSPLRHKDDGMKLSDLLRISRARTGLTFREAHRLTRTMAEILGNREYAIALGTLSDYEAMGTLPRHIAKTLSLCAVYCMDFRELMATARVNIDDSAKLPLPGPDSRVHFRSQFPSDAAASDHDIVTPYAQSPGTAHWKISRS